MELARIDMDINEELERLDEIADESDDYNSDRHFYAVLLGQAVRAIVCAIRLATPD